MQGKYEWIFPIPKQWEFLISDIIEIREGRCSYYADRPHVVQFGTLRWLLPAKTTGGTHTVQPVQMKISWECIAIIVYVLPSRYLIFRVARKYNREPCEHPTKCLQHIPLPLAHVPQKYNGIGVYRIQ